MAVPKLIIGQYYHGKSLAHQTDPRVKLAIMFLFAASIFLIKNFSGLIILALSLFLLVGLCKLPLSLTMKGIKPLFYILAFTFLIHIFTGGKPWADVGPVSISIAGLKTGTFVDFRLILLVVGSAILTLTSTPIELTDAIEYILSPLRRIRVPSHELAMMITIAIRFIPVLSDEADKIVKAQIARGANFDSKNPITRARSFIPILVPLFVSVFRRADELAEAMEARAYRGGEGRTKVRELKMEKQDYLVFAIAILLIGGMVWIGRMPIF
ncbi:MAG: energy-coupling factor transporter transmembrane component T [Actinomycetota bacterium]|nr:energy-coupling factor transporter transmembrane component T [Actinomycetota bacterium]